MNLFKHTYDLINNIGQSKTKRIAFLILTIVLVNIAFMFWSILPKDLFYKLDALAWVFTMTLIFSLCLSFFREQREFKYLSIWSVFASFNNFLDEVIYQNLKLTYAEICISVFISIITIMFYVKRKHLSTEDSAEIIPLINSALAYVEEMFPLEHEDKINKASYNLRKNFR